MRTKCSYCGQESTNQPHGDGCHRCLSGAMRSIEEIEEVTQYKTVEVICDSCDFSYRVPEGTRVSDECPECGEFSVWVKNW